MNFSLRLFPHTVTRRRQLPGIFNEVGEFVAGAIEEEDIRVNVQPLNLDDSDFVGGELVTERLKVYSPHPGALLAAIEDSVADEVLYDGKVFTVESTEQWADGHTKAILLRQS